MTYEELLESKIVKTVQSGFHIEQSELNPLLKPFQKFCVQRALKHGKFGLFEAPGLGKTIQQLEFAHQVFIYTGMPVILLAPLGVVGQTIEEEAPKFKYQVKELSSEITVDELKTCGIWAINYEQLDNIQHLIEYFGGVVLDESSILKNYNGSTKNKILETFANTQYKLACSASPSPNDELEIGNHAEFLDVMTSQDMRAIYFTTDKEIIKGDKYRLKKHSEKHFYKWISTWALMFEKPSDIGFNEVGYDLPELNLIERQIKTNIRNHGKIFNDVTVSSTTFAKELKLTKIERLTDVAHIVNNSTEQFVIWVTLDEEGEELRKLIPDALEVKGSDNPEVKKKRLLGFAKNEFRVLITKTKIAQFGLNYQNCHNTIFASFNFSFEALYQAIRRFLRFGQQHTVNAWLITTDTMINVIKTINEKRLKHEKMQSEMVKSINAPDIEIGSYDTNKVETDRYKLYQGDCIELIKQIPDNSIGYSFFSPPFAALYVFSNDPRDISNVRDQDEFFKHFEFLVPELFRVTEPGRLVTMHIMQSTTLIGRDGFYSLIDFRGDMIRLFQKYGFYFHEEHMIRKDPKTAAIRTKNRQLMHGTTKIDSTIVRPGLADYILSFKKPGINAKPVQNNIPFDLWCEMAEPVWIRVLEGDTLEYRSAKENDDERHLTPTQLMPIEWSSLMYSSPGDWCLCPFGGIGSEGYQWLRMDRNAIVFELKESYFNVMTKNCRNAIETQKQIQLF